MVKELTDPRRRVAGNPSDRIGARDRVPDTLREQQHQRVLVRGAVLPNGQSRGFFRRCSVLRREGIGSTGRIGLNKGVPTRRSFQNSRAHLRSGRERVAGKDHHCGNTDAESREGKPPRSNRRDQVGDYERNCWNHYENRENSRLPEGRLSTRKRILTHRPVNDQVAKISDCSPFFDWT